MTEAYFLGNAPSIIFNPFGANAQSFTYYYFSGKSGFTSPFWSRAQSQAIDEATYPAARWLIDYGRSYNTSPETDDTGDGVPLLMAHALNLNPNDTLTTQLPEVIITGSTMNMTFYGQKAGIAYRVETSKNLKDWTETGVTVSQPNNEGFRTAAVTGADDCGFIRLSVDFE